MLPSVDHCGELGVLSVIIPPAQSYKLLQTYWQELLRVCGYCGPSRLYNSGLGETLVDVTL